MFLNGRAIPDPDVHGRPIVDDSFYLIFNGWDRRSTSRCPTSRWAASWDVVLDTAVGRAGERGDRRDSAAGRGVLPVSGHQLAASCSRATAWLIDQDATVAQKIILEPG